MHYSAQPWDAFFRDNDVLVPYLDACVFATKRLRKLPQGAVLYEFGCGMGNNLRFLKGLFPKTRLLGSDVSETAIGKLNAAGIDNASFWVNGDQLGIQEPLDLVIERGALQCVSKEQAARYIGEIFAAMKSGGEAYFEIASPHHSAFKEVGDGGIDAVFGLRTFYTLAEIEALFSSFKINRIWHLTRDLVREASGIIGDAQGSWQVEVLKA